MDIWGDYYDKVEYLEKTGELDKSGSILYNPPRIIDVRYVGGGYRLDTKNQSIGTKYTKEYHIPFMVKDGDKIDGLIVVDAKASRGVFGDFHFCIAKVE